MYLAVQLSGKVASNEKSVSHPVMLVDQQAVGDGAAAATMEVAVESWYKQSGRTAYYS